MKTTTKETLHFIDFLFGRTAKEYYDTIDMYTEEIKKAKGTEIADTYKQLRTMYKKQLAMTERISKNYKHLLLGN